MSESILRIREDHDQPLRLLLLCSDSPQHLYLRQQVAQFFPGAHCIVESDAGQLRHLWKKGRYDDWLYKKYHGWRGKVSGAGARRRAYFAPLIRMQEEIPTPDLVVDTLNQAAVWERVRQWKPELTLCSGTRYIGPTLIREAGLMLNLHTGYLPDYRGNHCIFFALYQGEMDKVGATIHQLTEGLDEGPVLARVFPEIQPRDTEDVLYSRCIHLAIDRSLELAAKYERGETLAFTVQESGGKTYRHRDRSPWKEWKFIRMMKKRAKAGVSDEFPG